MAAKQENRAEGNNKDTLPNNIMAAVHISICDYENVCGVGFSDIAVDNFIRVTKKSRNREDRVN
jgi:hypothetical protein